jgi:hypothetical protein
MPLATYSPPLDGLALEFPILTTWPPLAAGLAAADDAPLAAGLADAAAAALLTAGLAAAAAALLTAGLADAEAAPLAAGLAGAGELGAAEELAGALGAALPPQAASARALTVITRSLRMIIWIALFLEYAASLYHNRPRPRRRRPVWLTSRAVP